MILAIDIGNTSIFTGLFRGDKILKTFRFSSDRSRMEDEYAILILSSLKEFNIKKDKIKGFCVSSVVPPITQTILRMLSRYFPSAKVVSVEPGIKTGISILYDNPRDVGADRIANAVGAWKLYRKENQGLIVVDFGTATTFDCISKNGEYLGGVIVPGIVISIDALFEKTSKLPRVEIKSPLNVIGRNTVNSIQSGIVYGYTSLVDGLIERISDEMGYETFTVATGGYAKLISSKSKKIKTVDENLNLYGLKIIFDLNA